MLNDNNRKEMKKLAFFAICIMALMGIVSCNENGGKNVVDGGHGIGIDTATINAIEQEEAADDIDVAPEDLWTEEAVEKQVRKYFDAVNATFAEGSDLSPFDLDKNYYTQYWNEVYDKVNKKDSQQSTIETCFFIDDNHWTGGMETPLEIKNMKVELLTGNMAEARLTLVEKDGGFSQEEILSLDFENNQWLIRNWCQPGEEISESILCKMEDYIR